MGWFSAFRALNPSSEPITGEQTGSGSDRRGRSSNRRDVHPSDWKPKPPSPIIEFDPWYDLDLPPTTATAPAPPPLDPNLDLSKPGQTEIYAPIAAGELWKDGDGENYWSNHGKFYGAPQAGQGFTAGALEAARQGMSQDNGKSQGNSNMTAQMFGDFQATAGQNNPGPGLGAYYDNAARQGQESIDRAAASRGAYGASSAMDASAEMNTNLAADRAKVEADYNLQRDDYNLRRLSTGSEIAQGADEIAQEADKIALGADANRRGWFDSGTAAASEMDNNERLRVNSGMDASVAAQKLREERFTSAIDILDKGDRSRSDRIEDQNTRVRENDAVVAGALNQSDLFLYSTLTDAEQAVIRATLEGDAAKIAEARAAAGELSDAANTLITGINAAKGK